MTTSSQLRLFWTILASSIKDDLPLIEALETYRNSLPDGLIQQKITEIYQKVRSGNPLSNTLSESGIFTDMECHMVRAGEIGGMLELTAERMEMDCVQTMAQAYKEFFQHLSTLLTSGVGILSALKLVRANTPPSILQDAIDTIHDGVREGETFLDSMRKSSAFSIEELNIIEASENKGELDYGLAKLAQES